MLLMIAERQELSHTELTSMVKNTGERWEVKLVTGDLAKNPSLIETHHFNLTERGNTLSFTL